MTIEEEDLVEIEKLIKKYEKTPEGCTFKHLEKESNKNSNDIALILHRLIQLTRIYKSGKLYLSVDSSGARVSKPPRTESQPVSKPVQQVSNQKPQQPVQAAPIAPIEPAKPKVAEPVREKIYGSLKRADLGRIAYFFWSVRNDGIWYSSNSVLDKLTLNSTTRISMLTGKLAKDGYLESDKSDGVRKTKYRWSGKFIYPFSKELPTDISLIHTVKAASKQPSEEPAADDLNKKDPEKENLKDISNNTKVDETIRIIDNQISNLKNEIERLEIIKKSLAG